MLLRVITTFSKKTKTNNLIMKNKSIILIALVTGLILMVPLFAMLFTREVNWVYWISLSPVF
jgi:hypothetical protein